MTTRHARALAALPVTAAGLLLAACTSSGASTRDNTAGSHPHSGALTAAGSPATGAAGAPTNAVATSGPSACALVTEQEITPLLGTDPGPGKATSDSTTTSCAYTQGVAVTIVVDHSGGKSQFDMFCPTNQAQPRTHVVSGVGDGACLTIVGGTGPIAAMYILKGPALLSINVQAGLDTKITSGALTTLGRTAAARL